jgi:glycosyltransferase involved in cell wall biosynthesis
MSTYNDARFLPQALDSALGQSFGDFELLVVNDNSSDQTDAVLRAYQKKDARIIFWTNPVNLGLTENLNAGLKRASGEYIARLDSDDFWTNKNKLQKQVEFLDRNPDCCLVGTWAEVYGSGNKKLYDLKYPAEDLKIRRQLLRHNCFVHSSVLIRKANILAAGSYDPNWQYIEDYALWLKLGLKAKFANIPEIMVRYRVNYFGVTRTKNKQQIRAVLSLIKEYKSEYPQYTRALFKWTLQYYI